MRFVMQTPRSAAWLPLALVCLGASVAIGPGVGTRPAVAEEAREPRPAAGAYTAWQYQPEKERFWCRYNYTNKSGQASYQFVLYYPDEKRNSVYYFQTPQGRI